MAASGKAKVASRERSLPFPFLFPFVRQTARADARLPRMSRKAASKSAPIPPPIPFPHISFRARSSTSVARRTRPALSSSLSLSHSLVRSPRRVMRAARYAADYCRALLAQTLFTSPSVSPKSFKVLLQPYLPRICQILNCNEKILMVLHLSNFTLRIHSGRKTAVSEKNGSYTPLSGQNFRIQNSARQKPKSNCALNFSKIVRKCW